MSPLVSVILPVYNREKTILRALESIENQTHDNLELVIVNDGSTDNTGSIIDEFKKESSVDTHIITHSSNKGANVARNTGIKRSEGDYISFLDSDDEWLPEKIELQLNKFHESVGVVYTGYYVEDRNGRRLGNIPKVRGDIYKKQLMRDHVSPTSCVMVHRKCLNKIGLFNPNLKARQDYEMWIRISKHFDFEYVEEPLTIIHKSPMNRISSDFSKRMEANLSILEIISEEVSSFDEVVKKKIFSKQFQSISLYCYLNERYRAATSWSIKSLRMDKTNMYSFILLILSFLRISPENRILLGVKNKFAEYL